MVLGSDLTTLGNMFLGIINMSHDQSQNLEITEFNTLEFSTG